MSPWCYVSVAWQETPSPWAPLPPDQVRGRPCQACGQAPGTVAVYEGRVWRQTLCAACARLHQEGHGLQLELFGEEDTSHG